MRKSDDYRSFRKPLWVYLRRLGFVILMGYWLHIPNLSLQKLLSYSPEQLVSLFQCDVLHSIVIASVFALILLFVVRNNKYLPYIYLTLAVIIIFISPTIRQMNSMSFMPPWLGTYFVGPPVSKFPLFPWTAYFFAGAAFTAFFFNIKDRRKFSIIVAISGFSAAAILFATRHITEGWMGVADWWQGSPQHTIFRLGGTVMVFSLIYLLEKYYKDRKIGDILRVCGQESLFVYIFHLMVVYGSVVNLGLKQFVGNNLNYYGTFLVILTLCTTNYWFAYIWNGFKTKSPELAFRVIMSLSLLFLVVLIFNPFG